MSVKFTSVVHTYATIECSNCDILESVSWPKNMPKIEEDALRTFIVWKAWHLKEDGKAVCKRCHSLGLQLKLPLNFGL